jgi:FdrA protein
MGQPVAARATGNLHFALNLQDAAALAVDLSRADLEDEQPTASFSPLAGRYLRGLFSGGTLAYELMLGLQNVLSPLYSNVPLDEAQRLQNPLRSKAHTILDLGADAFTQGRLHPMMDNTLRLRRMQQEAADPAVGLIVLDVVLGVGSHPDPASELAPAVATAIAQHDVEVAVLLVGTEDDPQDIVQQREQFREAGAHLVDSATALASAVSQAATAPADGPQMPVAVDLLQQPLAAVNVGLESFFASLKEQGAEAIQVDWRPPAGGNEKMMALLTKLKSS